MTQKNGDKFHRAIFAFAVVVIGLLLSGISQATAKRKYEEGE